MPPQAKRRRRQSSVLSFFQADPPTPPPVPSPTPSIPSAPSATASPVKCSTPTEAIPVPSAEPAPLPEKSFLVCSLSHVGFDVAPSPPTLSVCALPGVYVSANFGSPVTPADAKDRKLVVSDVDEIEEVPDDEPDDADDWRPVSRLSRSRNVARRSARLRAAKQQELDTQNRPEVSSPDEMPSPPSSSSDPSLSEPENFEKPQLSSPKRRKLHPFFAPKDTEKAKQVQPKKLHPFFAATAAAVSNARERKRTRPVSPPTDAWQCPSATVHFNAPQTLGTFQWSAGVTRPARQTCNVDPVVFSSYTGKADVKLRPVEDTPCESADTWVERYKRDRRIDVINGAATKELVDWLRTWYEAHRQTEVSDDSQDSYVMHDSVGERERVAIVTGPVGCGKSTVVSNAARQLGLSILEINASVCRTGKRIREIIGEALSTHRVTHQSVFQTFKAKVEPAAKTLILFEEVDELHDDEKGFWSTIQKLAASSDCRRPIVCTANSFTAQMRQYFVQTRATIEEDLDRLLINSPVEQLVNPIDYKLIEFQGRSERQASAVISRVCGTETADAVSDVANCIALSCRDDTRKGINLLHFWGANGLVHDSSPRRTRGSPPRRSRHGHLSEETQARIGTELFEAASSNDHIVSAFHTGSLNYVNSRSKKRNSLSKSDRNVLNDEALGAWCTSLEAISYADVIGGTVERAVARRNFEFSKEMYEMCMHTDIHQAAETAREINALSLQQSESYLRFSKGVQQVNEIAKEATKNPCAPANHISRCLPIPRRPVLLECLPILRTMALAEENVCSGPGSSADGRDRPMRRTRARSRQGGFCSLDLDPITILALRKTAIRTSDT